MEPPHPWPQLPFLCHLLALPPSRGSPFCSRPSSSPTKGFSLPFPRTPCHGPFDLLAPSQLPTRHVLTERRVEADSGTPVRELGAQLGHHCHHRRRRHTRLLALPRCPLHAVPTSCVYSVRQLVCGLPAQSELGKDRDSVFTLSPASSRVPGPPWPPVSNVRS